MTSRDNQTAADIDLDLYFELVRQFPLRHIRDEEEAKEAECMLRSLISRPLEPGEQDYLDVLTDLIERFETETVVIKKLPDHELVRYLLDENGITHEEVAEMIDASPSDIPEILSGRRKFTRGQVDILCKRFKIRPGAFTPEG